MGNIATFPQIDERHSTENLRILERLDNRGGLHFEDFVLRECKKAGFNAKRTPESGDGGVDIVLMNDLDEVTHLIQCKQTSNPTKPLSEKSGIVKDYLRAHHNWGAQKAIFVAITNAERFDLTSRKILNKGSAVVIERGQILRFCYYL